MPAHRVKRIIEPEAVLPTRNIFKQNHRAGITPVDAPRQTASYLMHCSCNGKLGTGRWKQVYPLGENHLIRRNRSLLIAMYARSLSTLAVRSVATLHFRRTDGGMNDHSPDCSKM